MRIQELTFSDDFKENNDMHVFKTPETCKRVGHVSSLDIEEPVTGECLLGSLFDEANQTMTNPNSTVLSPRCHKIYVDDTPVELQGLSMRERRKKERQTQFYI
jgi:hypothetical protein